MVARSALLLVVVVAITCGVDHTTPRRIQVDHRAEESWSSLFAADPGWIAWHLAVLRAHESQRWPDLLAARLLYEGPAWEDRPGKRDRQRISPHEAVRSELLRALRGIEPQPQLADAYRQALQRDWSATSLLQVLELLAALDTDGAAAAARTLAVPLSDGDGDERAVRIGVRLMAQAWLIEHQAWRLEEDRPLIRDILYHGDPAERLQMIRRSETQLIAPWLEDLTRAQLAGFQPDRMDPDRQRMIHALCLRLEPTHLAGLAELLEPVIIRGRRSEVVVLAGALARMPADALASQQKEQFLAAVRQRIGTGDDLAVRHALFGLLAAWQPSAVMPIDDIDGPWRRLARHRQSWQGVGSPDPEH